MSTSPTYKKIRDLNPKEAPDSGDELAVSDKDTLSTNRISINNLVKAAFSHDNSIFEADANGNLTLKLGAIDGSKISPGTIKSEQLAPGSITGDIIAPEAIQQHLTSTKTSNPTLADASGIVRTIASNYYGVISLLVNSRTDGLAYSNDHIDGPNPREFEGSTISAGTITILDHGLFNDSKINISSVTGSSFPESSPIIDGQDLYVMIIDKDNFSVSSTPGGLSINLGPGWGGKFSLTRDVIISMDIADWTTSSNTNIWAPTINYNFSTMQSAYSWAARNADLTYINFLFSHKSNPISYWNPSGSNQSHMLVDGQFNRPKVMRLMGNRNDGTNKQTGVLGVNGSGVPTVDTTVKSNYHSYNRARLKVSVDSNVNSIPIWIRGTSNLNIDHLWFEFDYQGTPLLNNLFNIGGTVCTWLGSSCDVINPGSPTKAYHNKVMVINAGECCHLYVMQSNYIYFGGLGDHDFIHVGTFSHVNVGAPNGWTYITTSSSNNGSSGTFQKRKYSANQASAIYHGYVIDNSAAVPRGGGTTLTHPSNSAF